MRKLSLIAFAWAVVLSTGQAQAAQLEFSGTLAIQLGALGSAMSNGSGVATVNGSGTGAHVNSLSVPASPFAFNGIVLPVTDLQQNPIKGIRITAHNASAMFAGGSVMDGLGGKMSLQGVAKLCLFAPCSAAAANIAVPLTVVGEGGAVTVGAPLLNVTVIGAPWTEGTAAVGTLTAMGFLHGPASGTSSTARPSGVVRLVTPIFISMRGGSFTFPRLEPTFGILTLHFVPEPSTLFLLGSGIAALVLFGRSRARD
jgi:hypothetical protein